MRKLETEADVINLIGYETAMEFVFVDENIATFKTVLPIMSKDRINDDKIDSESFKEEMGFYPTCQYFYEIEFFRDEDAPFAFFRLDSFSNFLQRYQIFRVHRIEDVTKSREQIYFKQYQTE